VPFIIELHRGSAFEVDPCRTRGYRALSLALLLLFAVCATPSRALAQGASCAVRGRVVRPGGSGLNDAAVRAVGTTGTHPDSATAGPTDATGQFCLALRGGGEYVLTVEQASFVARSMLVEVPQGGAVAVGDVQLTPATAYQLEAVLVEAPRLAPQATRRGAPAGSTLVSLSGSLAGAYPGAAGDLGESAGVSGQFVPVRGQDLSVEGQSPTGNRTTLDGSGFDSRDVPAEALAAAGVFAHPYDVSRGQFTGGEIAGRTLSGTNLWGGGLRATVGPPWLTSGRGPQASWGGNAQRTLLSGGGGGPLLPGRLFVYGAVQAMRRTSDAPGLHPSLGGLPAYGISSDTLQRFFGVLDRLGLNAYAGDATRRSQSVAALTRFDLLAGQHHAFMLRLDGRDRSTEGGAGTQLSTASAARDQASGAGILFQATSRDERGENTFQAGQSWSRQRTRSDAALPSGEVWVSAADAAGLPSGGANLRFGGDSFARPDETRSLFNVEDRLELRAGAAHRLLIGATWQAEEVSRTDAGDLGRYTFASLEDVEAGRPTRFTRSLGADSLTLGTRYMAAFLGDHWKHGAHLRAVAGLRVERYGYTSRAGADAFAGTPWADMRATPASSGWGVSPRAGVSWFRVTGNSEFGLQGGSGIFRGAAPTRALAARLLGPSRRLECVGDDVPVPGWAEYARGTGSIPSACLDGAMPAASGVPGASGFADGYAPPRVWHSSVEAMWHDIPSGASLTLRLGASRGRSLGLATERNLASDPAFRLAGEAGRPVYVAAGSIDPGSGQLSSTGSRLDPRFGSVQEIGGGGQSAVRYGNLSGDWLSPIGSFTVDYTLTRSRDQATGLGAPEGGEATTGGDPRVAEWGSSDFEQRHAVQLSFIRYLGRWGTLTTIGRFVSGTPFTPMVDSDVNGDGIANDRAFIPAAGDGALGSDVGLLLDRLPAGVRECLSRQSGTIAGRNSCRNAWSTSLDAQLNVFPAGRRNRRYVLNLAAENVTTGLDRLFHGPSGLHGWGQVASADPVLLRAVGFDAGTQRFRYEVNPAFGTAPRRLMTRPFAVRIQARIAVGADPATQAMVAQVAAHQDRIDIAALRTEMLRKWRNVPGEVLGFSTRSPSLGVTAAQTAQLRAAADSVAGVTAEVAPRMAQAMADLGVSAPAEVRAALARQGELQARVQAALDRGAERTAAILTRDQWARLPRALRVPPQAPIPFSPQGGVQLLSDF
jgi:hypothetical protein